MNRSKRRTFNRFRTNRRAASPAISTVIITAVTVVLVLVAGTFAYQTLDRQKGATEFETVKTSIVSFDDAIRDVAWENGSARSAKFTLNYGFLRLVSNTVPLKVNMTDSSGVSYANASYSTMMGYVQYSLSNTYLTFGDNYTSYFLGSDRPLSTSSTESLGRAYVGQVGSWVNITLNYRVRAMKVYTVPINQSGTLTQVSYVDIWIIRFHTENTLTYTHSFDLSAKTTDLATFSCAGEDGRGYPVSGGKCGISVQIGSTFDTDIIQLDGDRVVFNFIISEIGLSG